MIYNNYIEQEYGCGTKKPAYVKAWKKHCFSKAILCIWYGVYLFNIMQCTFYIARH